MEQSNRIKRRKQLREMRRRYKRELYSDRVDSIRQQMPHCCIGVDVIVGFPGETDEDFKETYKFIQELDISYLHVFTYSERANTPAAEMENVIPVHIRRERGTYLYRRLAYIPLLPPSVTQPHAAPL